MEDDLLLKLEEWNLGKYVDMFEENGITDIEIFSELEPGKVLFVWLCK